MAGRPKKEDSRDKQYRVRLNDEEEGMLDFAAQTAGIAKSEIFRSALREYFHNLRLRQFSAEAEPDEDWADGLLSLKRVVECPHCGAKNRIDLADDESTSVDEDRPMGSEILHEFEDVEFECINCDQVFTVSGYISEYPLGALNHEEIHVSA